MRLDNAIPGKECEVLEPGSFWQHTGVDMTEDKLQKDIVKALRKILPDTVLMYHCPNGGKRSARSGAQFKNMGVLPGVPDLCFVLPSGRAAFIEIKQPGGKLSTAQQTFGLTVTNNGGFWNWTDSVDGAINIVKSWEI